MTNLGLDVDEPINAEEIIGEANEGVGEAAVAL
jgi:hypothetical protein